MNKKFSTLIAAFLAAGSFVSVEAGVVKITTPKSGHQYVIANGNWGASQTGSWIISEGLAVKASAQANTTSPTITATGQWMVDIASGQYSLSQPVSGGTGYVWEDPNDTGKPTLTVASGDAAKMTYNVNTGVLSAGTNKDWTFTAGSGVSGVTLSGSGTAVAFFVLTEKIAENAVPQNLKIGDKYLVLDPTDGKTPKLVDEATFTRIGAILPNNLLWTISGDGQYETSVVQSTPANKFLKIATDGTLSLEATGDAPKFEENTTEGLFVSNAAGVISTLVSEAGVVKLITTAPSATQTPVAITAADSKAVGLAAVIPGYDFAPQIDGGYYYLGVTATGANKGFVAKATASAASTVATTNLDKFAYWRAVQVEPGIYTFTNQDGVILAIDNVTKFKVKGNANAMGFELWGGATYDKYVEFNTGALSIPSAPNTPGNKAIFGAYQAPAVSFTAEELVVKQGTSFSLLLKDATTGVDQLMGNVFGGNLVPVQATLVGNQYRFVPAVDGATEYLLMRESDGQIIVLDQNQKWSVTGIDEHVTAGGFKFATLTQENMDKYLRGVLPDMPAKPLAYTFSIKHEASLSAASAPIKYVTVTDLKTLPEVDVVYYLATYETTGTTYLTVNTKPLNTVNASFDNLLIVKGKHTSNNPLLSRYVNISFVNVPGISYTTEAGRFAALNGKVLGLDKTGNDMLPTEADKFLAGKPEGQWAVKMGETVATDNVVVGPNGEATKFIFVNREKNDIKLTVERMYYIGNDNYAVEYASNNAQFAIDGYGIPTRRDTLKITAAPAIEYAKAQLDGYKNYSASDLTDQLYRISVASTSGVDYYVSENHASQHLLGMTKEVEGAVNWRIVPMTAKRTHDANGYLRTPSDSVYTLNHSQYFDAAINGYRQVNDTLAIVSYAIQNTENGEYLTYENPQKQDILSMICQPNSVNYTSADLTSAFRFVLKEKANGLFNIVGVNSPATGTAHYTLNTNNKLYGATTQKGGAVEVEDAYAQINSNDLFNVTKVEAPEYRKMSMGDTIRVFRDENKKDVMFENGEFLNLGNIAQLTKMAPALYVDTAYVTRGHNNRYQYLLVVNPTYVPASLCTIDGHPAIHPDTTYGRFLVNLIDSAVYTYKNGEIHTNKYINDKEANEPFAKLGFVWGFRTADKLYITTDKTFGTVKSIIDLGTPEFNVAKFAFRFVNPTDASDKTFKIQTRYVDYSSAISVKDQKDRAENNNGFLKTINGVVVVTNGYAKGEVFDLAAEASNPTDNEGIQTTEMSVIAGEGQVVINNAAGKTVAVSNILGQTIANTVLTSDNATIAVPAGIVVVAVEGEAAVKAIVK